MWSYTQENLTDSEILTLAEKISVHIDQEANNEFPQKNGCIVEITTSFGKSTIRVKDPKGSPLNLCSLEDITEKFYKNTLPILKKRSAEALYRYLLQFENHLNLSELGILTNIYSLENSAIAG